ncbi:uncharacterized protein LOC123266020 [Cotesia glomerata]|uniref:uncharacterized protein LOC123266020 n=1 Tax=Cotesia glomerata TaxID=32391 RepID=UPI001D00EFAF|nr:uncharacterized protein LOC123266020 [Cotesia glomerata]
MVTSVLEILDKDKRPIQCRGLLDTCSTTNFITRRLADVLKLKKTSCNVPVGALNSMTTYCTELATATIKSRLNDYKKTLTFLVVPEISHFIPDQPIHRELIKIPDNIVLADPNFHKPAPVDLLLGAGTTLSLLSVGQIKLSSSNQQELYLQKTMLGWIIGGAAPSSLPTSSNCYLTTTNLDFDLQKFWEIEECPTVKRFTAEEEKCEQHFRKHVTRDSDGRYVVALPFNPHTTKLGKSYHLTRKRFDSTERRLNQKPELKIQYEEVLQDYLKQNHMSPMVDNPLTSNGYYLPHHAVMKETSLTTKVRVVFDGSLKTSSGVSLNDVLYTGPTIQPDLFTILIRFCKHPIVITGDLKQMYRQFLVRKQDRKFQRILWRNEAKKLQTYELNTVTFGITCAAYLAIRCLHQLSEDEGESYPVVAPLLLSDFYVDDFLSGTKTKEEAKLVITQMIGILSTAGLTMRQWASNDPSVLEDIPAEDVNPRLQLGDTTLKTLGIHWDSRTDTITYTVNPIQSNKITKRIILSEVAKIFDPLGLLAPVIILAKIILQNLWNYKLDWDESLPADLHSDWQKYCEQLPSLNLLSFPRTVITADLKEIQLHGFSDASEKAYGACVYLRTVDHLGNIKVQLLCAKSRVAPIKTLTIPRLELRGAQLLSTLIKTVKTALDEEVNIFYWTDSTIVLRWLQISPQQLKTVVAHRVAEIQTVTQVKSWRHVPTEHNPADLVSRGVLPAEFPSANLWKDGPSWLSQLESFWPSHESPKIEEVQSELPEQRRPVCLVNAARPFTTLTRFPTLERMIRGLAYCFRFVRKDFPAKFLTVNELRHVETRVLRCVQSQAFPEDIKNLISKDRKKSVSSNLLKLSPFLDQDGIMRVGGRLYLSNLPFDAKHPIILPKNNHVTDLFIMYFHKKHLHTGVQQTLYTIRRKYWIIDGRSQVYKNLKQCCNCFKASPPPTEYVMGKLPKARVNIANPFNQVGVDYCGPFLLKEKKFRNRVSIKAYVAVFVCLAVKAVHLELVTDLTSDGFLSALRRFISRRGLCQDIYSDNGTNFVGANNILKEFIKDIKTTEAQNKIQGYLSDKSIQWHFSPPHAPYVGGQWEAAVKSFKKHLGHVAGHDMLFTYEQFNTLIIEIEAILNSRPMTTISSDPTDPIPLTPGHFLIGDSLTNLRGYDYTATPDNRLSYWQHLQKVKQHFWNRWSKEYLNELTVRTKWEKAGPEIINGSIVLLREDNIPPAQWALGKIVECYPGSDGVVRTALVKTAKSSFGRNVKKLAILPISISNSESKLETKN